MTANQVAYWKNVETQRANQANEAIKRRENEIRDREAGIKEFGNTISVLNTDLKRREVETKEKAANIAQGQHAMEKADWIRNVPGNAALGILGNISGGGANILSKAIGTLLLQ